jgi:hypothetical protein
VLPRALAERMASVRREDEAAGAGRAVCCVRV